jgi:hypothetical protein
MVLYPEVSTLRQFVAWMGGVAVAIPAGFGLASLLRTVREAGRASRFIADLWVGWVAAFLGVTIAVAIAGPYLFAEGRSGRVYPEPYTHAMGMLVSVPFGVIVAWSNWSSPIPRRPRLRRRIGAAIREAERRRRDA